MPGKNYRSSQSKGALSERLKKEGGAAPKVANLHELLQMGELETVVQTVLEAGGAFMISRTSDGGAIVFTVFLDDLRHRVYAAGRDQWLVLMETVSE